MNLDQIECAVSAAETLNFSNTAEKLFITQSTVSRRIAALEDELGFKLFDRCATKLILTEAGKECIQYMRDLVNCAHKIQDFARLYRDGQAGVLNIACYFGQEAQKFIGKACANIKKECPMIKISTKWAMPGQIANYLQNGTIDIAFSVSCEIDKIEDVEIMTLIPMRWVIICPPKHPLAERKTVSFADLRNETFIHWERSISPYTYDTLIHCTSKHGYTPKFTKDVVFTVEEVQLAVMAGQGISVSASGDVPELPDAIRMVPLVGFDICPDYCAAFLNKNSNKLIPLFWKEMQKIWK
ncbi:MAG: LysR substrate-binding domain-containing protein [Christensenellales bacterium]|jgi:DNA-binding transcriptional LysR family regulator